jgi:hypothetical protein
MVEPIGILSGALTVLETSRQLYNFIENIADAPDVIRSAKADLRMMVEVLEDLKQLVSHKRGNTLPNDASVSLQICLEKCRELQALLSGLVDHTSSGRFSIGSWTRVARRKSDIENLRRDIGSGRESLAVALGSLNL